MDQSMLRYEKVCMVYPKLWSVSEHITGEEIKQSRVLPKYNYPRIMDEYNTTNTIHISGRRLRGQVHRRGTCRASIERPTGILPHHTRLEREKYNGIALDWDYKQTFPGYIRKALTQFNHPTPKNRQDLSYPSAPTKYGAKIQYAQTPVDVPLLDEVGENFIQQVCGKVLFYGRAVDGTILIALSAIASQQSKPTIDTMAKTKQLLDYLTSQKEAIITYSASKIVLAVHSDAGYLKEPNARSRAEVHFSLSNHAAHLPNNGAILNLTQIIENVMSSVTEAELGALFITATRAVYIRNILMAMGNKQPATPIQTDNLTTEGIINSKNPN